MSIFCEFNKIFIDFNNYRCTMLTIETTKGYEMTREEWLMTLVENLRPVFEEKGFPIPEKVRASVGIPKGKRTAIGQCFSPKASETEYTEIFISPKLADSLDVAQTFVHELIHAAVGVEEGHKGNFKVMAGKMNLGGKMTATVRTPEFDEWMTPIIEKIGKFPHEKLDTDSGGIKKQTTRLIKCECPECGYVVRTTAKWIEQAGAPCCPLHGQMNVF